MGWAKSAYTNRSTNKMPRFQWIISDSLGQQKSLGAICFKAFRTILDFFESKYGGDKRDRFDPLIPH